MNTSYTTLLILLYLSNIDCGNMQIAKLLPAYDSNIDIIVNEISRMFTSIERNRFGKTSFIKIILPTVNDNTIMPQIIDKTAQKLSSNWLITTNDSFCCDSHEPRISLPKKPMIIEYAPDFYIIPLRKHDGLKYLDAQINLMKEENTFNPHAIFFLVILTQRCGFNDSNATNLYFDLMWGKNCMSLIILVLSECDFQITIITATPFSVKNICRKLQEKGTKMYNSNWNEEDLEHNIYKTDHKNFNQCPFSVGTIPTPPNVVGKPYKNTNETHYKFVGGTDLEILHLVSTIYNFTYVFDLHHGYDTGAMARFSKDGQIVGFFADLLQNSLDISLGSIIAFDFNYFRYHYTGNFKFSSFGWAVSDASPVPQWKIFLGAFSQDVWIISGLVFVVTSFLYSFLDGFILKCLTENHNNRIENLRMYCNFQAMPLIQYFSITLGLSSMLNPKSFCLRVLYFSWSIYSLHMCIAYSSMLFLLISNPPLEKEIKTVEDLKISGLKVASSLILFQRFKAAELDDTTRDIINDSLVCSTWESCIEDLITHRNFSLLIMQDKLEYYVNTKQSKIHTLTEAFFSYGNCVMTSKGNPLILGFDKIITLAVQSGLAEKWDRDTKSKESVNVNDGSKDENNATILTVSDLKGAFFVLMGGIFISSLLFCGELVVSFLQK